MRDCRGFTLVELMTTGNDPVTRWGGVGANRGLGSSGSVIADLSGYFSDFDRSVRCSVDTGRYHLAVTLAGTGQTGTARFVCQNGHTY
jgi:hypothetical protein